MSAKVCHITSAHPRHDRRILLKECVSLAKAGYDVHLIVNDHNADEVFEGVKIRSTQFQANSRIKRFVLSHRKLFKIAREVDADIYHFHDPDLLPMMSKMRRRGKKVVFDSHENIPKQILSKGWLPSPIRKITAWIYEKYEILTVARSHALISVTPAIVERFRKFQENSYLVTNYPIMSATVEIAREQRRAIGFAGGIGDLYNHLTILDALESVDDVVYHLAGRADSLDYIAQIKKHRSSAKVKYWGQLSPFDVYKLVYDNVAVGMCLHSAIQAEGMGSLGVVKLFEMMERGLPIVCSNYPIWEEINDKYDFGICVDPKDAVAVGDAITFLLDNPERARQMGENGRRAVEVEFNWSKQEKVLLGAYASIYRD